MSEGILHYIDDQGPKNAPVILMIHGWGQTKESFAPLAGRLKDRLRVVATDLAGHGSAKNVPGPYTFDRYTLDIATIVKKLDIPRFHLLGWSMGGTVAAKYCINMKGPAPLSLTLLSASARFVAPGKERATGQSGAKVRRMLSMMSADPEAGLKAFIGMFFATGEALGELAKNEIERLLLPPGLTPCGEAMLDTLRELASVDLTGARSSYKGVVTAICGDMDSITPPGGQSLWRRIFPGVSEQSIKGSGHAPHLTKISDVADSVYYNVTKGE